MKRDGESTRQGDLGRPFWVAGDEDKEVLTFAVMNTYHRMEGRWQ